MLVNTLFFVLGFTELIGHIIYSLKLVIIVGENERKYIVDVVDGEIHIVFFLRWIQKWATQQQIGRCALVSWEK